MSERATFVVVPEWQGSGSSRALRLVDGAAAVRGDLPRSATVDVEVPVEAGENLDSGVARLSSVLAVRDRHHNALRQVSTWALTVGGDCGVELSSVAHAVSRATAAHQAPVAVVWFDAHADLHTPQTSPTGAFSGMVLRTLLGTGHDQLVPSSGVVAPENVVLAGARSFDAGETEFIETAGIAVISPRQLLDPTTLVHAVEKTGARSIYVHVDLDVLDPAEIAGLGTPEPFGVTVVELVAAITAIRERFVLVGAGLTQFFPATPSDAERDLPSILRIVGALTARSDETRQPLSPQNQEKRQ